MGDYDKGIVIMLCLAAVLGWAVLGALMRIVTYVLAHVHWVA